MLERMKRIEEKMLEKHLKLLNECAAIVYENQGYHTPAGYDFSKATHPQEQTAFAIAVRVYNHIADSKTAKKE